MKTKLGLLLILLSVFFIDENGAAQAPKWKWAKSVGTLDVESGYSITTDTWGNTYVTGGFYSSQLTFGSYTLNNYGITGDDDVFIVKYDSAGNVIWAKSAGGVNFEHGSSITTDAAGNVYVAGGFSSPFITCGTQSITNSSNGIDIFILKLDSAGNTLWLQNPIGLSSDWANGISADTMGNCYVTGYFTSSSISFGLYTLTNFGINGVEDFFIAKYDASGNVVWAHSIGGAGTDKGNSIATDANGSSYVTGYFNSTSLTFGSDTLINKGSDDIFIVKYNAGGNVIWANRAGGTSDDQASSISTDSAGNSYVTGYFHSQSIAFGPDTLINTNNSADVFIVKYDPAGNAAWAKKAGGTNYDYGSSIAVSANGNSYFTGYFQSPALTFGSDSLNNISSSGSADIFILKYNTAGNVIWAKSAGGWGSDYGTGIKTDDFNNVYLTGYFDSSVLTIGSDTLNNYGNKDILITKIFECYTTDTTLNITACNTYTSPSGNYTWINSGTYMDTIPNSKGCDSVITVNLTINYATASMLTITACNSYTSPSGNYLWNSSGFYNDTIPNSNGCDSLITINLTINPLPVALYTLYPDTTTPHNWFALNQCTGTPPLTYMWNWGDSSAVSTGATPMHVYADSGYYNICVTITDGNGCVGMYCDSSTYIYRGANNSMVTLSVVMQLPTGIDQLNENDGVLIYPNPAIDGIMVTFKKPMHSNNKITINDLQGRVIKEEVISESKSKAISINISALSKGVYWLNVNNSVHRLVKM